MDKAALRDPGLAQDNLSTPRARHCISRMIGLWGGGADLKMIYCVFHVESIFVKIK